MSKKILVVDDSASIRKSISYVLEQEGFEVQEAEDGMVGVSAVSSNAFDLIITDVNMPNLDGIGFIRQARAIPECRFIPIIVLTTESQQSKMQEGREAGATGWIVKPFSADKLIAVVRKVLG